MVTTKDYLHLHFIVVVWGFTAILGLLISIPAWEMVFYRTLIAFLALGMVLYFRGIPLIINYKDLLKIFLTGLLMGAHWVFFFASARVSTASVSLVGFATLAFWTSLFEPWMIKRKIRWIEVLLGLLVLCGLYIIFSFEFNYAWGLVLAIISAILAALFTVINSTFIKKHHPLLIMFYEMNGACMGIVIFSPIYLNYFSPHSTLQLHLLPLDWLYIGILSLVCTVYAYSASIYLMKKVSPFTISLTVNLEPVYGIILAVMIFGEKEKMTSTFYLGTVIILISVFIYPVLTRYLGGKKLKTDLMK